MMEMRWEQNDVERNGSPPQKILYYFEMYCMMSLYTESEKVSIGALLFFFNLVILYTYNGRVKRTPLPPTENAHFLAMGRGVFRVWEPFFNRFARTSKMTGEAAADA